MWVELGLRFSCSEDAVGAVHEAQNMQLAYLVYESPCNGQKRGPTASLVRRVAFRTATLPFFLYEPVG